MATKTHWLLAPFGANFTGNAANIRCTVYDASNTVRIAATNTPDGTHAFAEAADAAAVVNTGRYGCPCSTIDDSWLPARAIYTIVGQTGVACEQILGEYAALLSNAPSTFLDTISIADVASDTDARSTLPKMLRALFNRQFNKVTATAQAMQVFNDANTPVMALTVADDGTTATKSKSA